MAHNTYLEFFVVGGLWGILTLLYYIGCVRKKLKFVYEFIPLKEKGVVVIVIFALAATGLFLSITYNSILWLPFVLAFILKQHELNAKNGLIKRN